jgi:hypothetical protein
MSTCHDLRRIVPGSKHLVNRTAHPHPHRRTAVPRPRWSPPRSASARERQRGRTFTRHRGGKRKEAESSGAEQLAGLPVGASSSSSRASWCSPSPYGSTARLLAERRVSGCSSPRTRQQADRNHPRRIWGGHAPSPQGEVRHCQPPPSAKRSAGPDFSASRPFLFCFGVCHLAALQAVILRRQRTYSGRCRACRMVGVSGLAVRRRVRRESACVRPVGIAGTMPTGCLPAGLVT